ncbi:nitrate- and nitrite sensing domain-containing protein [Streptomyces sp. NPDC002104]
MAFSALGTLRSLEASGSATTATEAAATASLSRQAAVLAAALQDEAGRSALPPDRPAAAPKRAVPPSAQPAAATDRAWKEFLDAASRIPGSQPALRKRLEEFIQRAPSLPQVRRSAEEAEQRAQETSTGNLRQQPKAAETYQDTLDVQRQYETLIAPLLGLHNEISLTPEASAKGKSLSCLSVVKSAMSTQRSLITAVLGGRLGTAEAAERVQVAAGLERAALGEFQAGAGPGDAQLFSSTVSALGMERFTQLRAPVMSGTPTGAGLATTPQAFFDFAGAQVDQLHKVEDQLGQDLADITTGALTDAGDTAVRSGVCTLLVVLLSVALINSGWGEPIPLERILRAAAGEVSSTSAYASSTYLNRGERPRLGLTTKELAHHNRRLAVPPALDGSAGRRMGLYVVARLAEHHAIHVELRAARKGVGTTAMITLPPALCSLGEPDLEPRRVRHSR